MLAEVLNRQFDELVLDNGDTKLFSALFYKCGLSQRDRTLNRCEILRISLKQRAIQDGIRRWNFSGFTESAAWVKYGKQ